VSMFRKKQAVIDLRVQDKPRFEFGLPVPCPACGQAGYLDGMDLRTRKMFQHCPACMTKWETSEADLLVLNLRADRRRPAAAS
jgi:hypothetical protein